MKARERNLGIATLVVVGGGVLWSFLIESNWRKFEELDE